MKFIKLACLSSLLWLTGCASIAPGPEPIKGPAASANATSGSQPSDAYSPFIPSGELQPITAAQAASRAVTQLAPPTDIWDRIRRGYGMPNLESDLVLDREQWYSTRPDYILRMTERSNKYLFHIVEELERRNMPSELALLPFIESAFNPQAVSSAKAAGMWQFMPATGKSFDLKQNVFRDDRRDVLASTRAALDYLQKLYGMFGDWDLALAAYNWGEGSVGRAIAKNKRAGLGLKYTDLTMPAETRLYVPKLQAIKNIVSNPLAFNTRLPLIGNHPYFQTVDIKHDIDVALVAKLAQVTPEDFKALNPAGGSRPVILAAGTPQILLPWDNAIIFQSNLKTFSGGRLASWTVWRAPTTMKPSEAAKRVGMTEDELRSVNKIPPRVVIKAGSSLLVPRPTQLVADVAEHVDDNAQLSLGPDVILKRTVLKAGKKDSVASLAHRYRVSPASVAEWNKVSASAVFKAGQQVVMFLPVRAKTLVQGKSVSKRKATSQQARHKASKPTRLAKRH
ncbi:transglycosylase SLT domain-containing protein [Rhodoferax sp.]|uniref:transglycosylase SLT domain-containing protein n=1 Tax=Rhodoferax sp. TaxID=50421 RepID=UPI00374DB167